MSKPSRPAAPTKIEAAICVQDPWVLRKKKVPVGLTTILLNGQYGVRDGPMSSRFEVVDDDAELAELNGRGTAFKMGKKPPLKAAQKTQARWMTRNRKFRQVNPWAIVSRLLALLESDRVFCRRIPWAFDGGRLQIRPHDTKQSRDDLNAWYDKNSKAIRFGYVVGENGQGVYTCLSHDVIAHEFGHAVLDGLKPYYEHPATPDQDAFHEFFGDFLAMFSLLTMDDVIRQSLKGKKSLKQALGYITDLMEELGATPDHRRTYTRRVRTKISLKDLKKRATWRCMSYPGTYEIYDGARMLSYTALQIFSGIFRKLKHREDRVKALHDTAAYTSKMLLRAVDYCPPVGLTYEDYALAVIRSDEVAHPKDENGFRATVRQVFKRQGIRLAKRRAVSGRSFRAWNIDDITSSNADAYAFIDQNRSALQIPDDANVKVAHVYQARKPAPDGADGARREAVVEFVWNKEVDTQQYKDKWRIEKSRAASAATVLKTKSVTMWCGGTIVMDEAGKPLHYTLSDAGKKRERDLVEYLVFQADEAEETAKLLKEERRSKQRSRREADSAQRGARRGARCGIRQTTKRR